MEVGAEIVNPIDEFEIKGGQRITIWPWFDLKGTSEKLDWLWEEYRTTRFKSGIEVGFPSQIDPIKYLKEFGCTPEDLLYATHLDGQYKRRSKRRIEPICPLVEGEFDDRVKYSCDNDQYNKRKRYQALGQAREALRKALGRHLGVDHINDVIYHEYGDPEYVHLNKWWEDLEMEEAEKNQGICIQCREARRLNKDGRPLCSEE